jgi:hypothetical protein
VAFGPQPTPTYLVLAVIGQGGYGANAAAPLVRNVFNYLLTNPIGAVKLPTGTNPPNVNAATPNPPASTPTTSTTTTTAPTAAATTTPSTAVTTTTAGGANPPTGG